MRSGRVFRTKDHRRAGFMSTGEPTLFTLTFRVQTHTGGARFGTDPPFDGCEAAFTGLMPQKCSQLLRIAAAAVGEPGPGSPSQVSDIFS